ncbi:hypothetical protein ANCDUO_23543 [Ancylostoma duodenale]|uniref:Uncharacterized protein n=1 Tax=Ancylostoma duodenale TaxID=51022 RepID=A0A0C2FD08_9BILA|nr:hypothetical protein ANCDUO_23543 [Ancylostoma duodenale]
MLSVPSNGQNPLDKSGSREGQMEGSLTPARYTQRSTGVKVARLLFDLTSPGNGPASKMRHSKSLKSS